MPNADVELTGIIDEQNYSPYYWLARMKFHKCFRNDYNFLRSTNRHTSAGGCTVLPLSPREIPRPPWVYRPFANILCLIKPWLPTWWLCPFRYSSSYHKRKAKPQWHPLNL